MTHRRTLNNGTHHNAMLKRAWKKYGEENFLFEVVEECDKGMVKVVEQKYLDANEGEYNIGKQASGGDNLTNNPNREVIIEKMTKSLKERFANLTEEEIQLKYAKFGDSNPNWRGGTSVKYCVCGKQIAQDHNFCIKCVNKSGENNAFYNKKHTEEAKKKMSEKQMGRYDGEQNIPIVVNGVEYRSSGEAGKALGIPMVTVRWRVLSENKKFANYHYKN